MFRGYLAIPYLRPAGVISIRFRCIKHHEHAGHGKYMTVAGDSPHLFNTQALMKPSPVVAVTEGELDAVTAQLCGVPAVGVPGAHAWQPHFRELFLGYKDVFVVTDGDSAGGQFGAAIAGQLPNAKVIPMPPGEDVNSLVVTQGPQAFTERLK
jgi:DNA primase